MKKKIKIFSTIASLCLAVALMAFGVYAATQVSLTATSTIHFAATEIQGYWSLQVKGGDYAGEYTTLTKVVEATKEAHNRKDVEGTATIGDINLRVDEEGVATVEYTVEFTQTGEKAATITVEPKYTAQTGFEVSPAGKQEGDTSENGKFSVTFTVTLDTKTPGFDSGSTCEFPFDIDCMAVPAA